MARIVLQIHRSSIFLLSLDGQISKLLSSPSRKKISLNPSGKSKLKCPPSCPARGALAIVTNVGAGCGGRSSVGREMCLQGGFRERATARRRPALKRLRQNFFRQHMSRSKGFGWGSCGRQSRVVLAPVAGVKLMEIREPDRASMNRQSVSDGGKTNSSPGRARYKPLKPLRRESRVFRRTCGHPCAFCAHDCGC